MSSMESRTQREVCAPCGQEFEGWQAYLRHIIASGEHPHACAICGQEFLSDEGKQKHQRQAHPPDQNLTCAGCNREFTRCGSLVQHVEIDGCPGFRKKAFDKIQEANDSYYKKMGAKKQIAATTSPAPPGSVGSGVETASQAPPSGADALKIQKNGRGSTDNVVLPKQSMDIDSPTKGKGKAEVDLISMSPNRVSKRISTGLAGLKPFNIAAGGAENSTVRKENVPLGKEAPEMFPPPARSLKSLGPVPRLSGGSNQPLDLRPPMFTNAGPDHGALPRTSDTLPFQAEPGKTHLAAHGSESTPKEPAPYYHRFDPDQPGFNLEEYRNPYSKKYRCAFLGCTKLLNSAEGLYMHLKSNAHLTELYSCPFCFNQFNSASAITQHLESQTNRCNARDDRRFNQLIDQVAAGMIDAAGTHDDNTHRYYSAQLVPKLQLDTVHEANEEVIMNAVHDPEYRSARLREREQKTKEDRARIEAWQNDDWAE